MADNEINTKLSGKKPYAFLFLLCCVLLNNWINREFILTHEVYYNLYRHTVAPEIHRRTVQPFDAHIEYGTLSVMSARTVQITPTERNTDYPHR
jgi:hypothetical protein